MWGRAMVRSRARSCGCRIEADVPDFEANFRPRSALRFPENGSCAIAQVLMANANGQAILSAENNHIAEVRDIVATRGV